MFKNKRKEMALRALFNTIITKAERFPTGFDIDVTTWTARAFEKEAKKRGIVVYKVSTIPSDGFFKYGIYPSKEAMVKRELLR